MTANARISRYETGVHEPPFEIAQKIGAALSVPAAFFYCEDDGLAEIVLQWGLPRKGPREGVRNTPRAYDFALSEGSSPHKYSEIAQLFSKSGNPSWNLGFDGGTLSYPQRFPAKSGITTIGVFDDRLTPSSWLTNLPARLPGPNLSSS